MPHQVRKDPIHKREIARRRLDRANRKPGTMILSTGNTGSLAEQIKQAEPLIRRTFRTDAKGGYRVTTPPGRPSGLL
jgi:hypothetical protein